MKNSWKSFITVSSLFDEESVQTPRRLRASARGLNGPYGNYNLINTSDSESGNVLVYVLIAVVLFGSLSFALSRQTHNAGTAELDDAKMEFYASEIIGYSAQAQSVIDQMMITGSSIGDLNLVKPDDASFSIYPHGHKVYHPQGGGLDIKSLPEAVTVSKESEDPGWYITSSINVEWTKSTSTDVILTAYQISKPLCALLNDKITGSNTIPALSGRMKDYFINTGSNNDLNTSSCADCEGYSSLCVSNNNGDSYSFYNVLTDR